MNHGSLFSGIGGFDLAAEWMGWSNVFHCEWEPFPQAVLKHYWPEAITYGDITKTDFTIHRGTIDVLSGGFPCQPYSSAGKRRGKEDERHLWPEMLRAIREIQPRWVVGENVFGLVNWNGGLVFDEVQADLEAEGYEVQPYILPAASVNAPHQRYRVWFVAHSKKANSQQCLNTWTGGAWDTRMANVGPITNTASHRRERTGSGFEIKTREAESGKRGELERGFKGLCVERPSPYPCCERSQRNQRPGKDESTDCPRQKSAPRSASKFYSCADWQKFPTQSPVCSGDDGIPRELDGITFSKWRNESIKAYGNAVVPQVVMQIFKAIEAYEKTN